MNTFLILHPTGLVYRFMHNKPIFNQNQWNLANMCVNSMSMTICHHICYFIFVTENKGIFLSDDLIWKCQNLNSQISNPSEILCSNFQDFLDVIFSFK